tara:strand:+ start:1979 stop:2209 length:231 start_codon:yes stop_codon:yes gene_type:complete
LAKDFPLTVDLLTAIGLIRCVTKRIYEACEGKNRKAWYEDETDSQVWLDEPPTKVMKILIIFFEPIHIDHFDLGAK